MILWRSLHWIKTWQGKRTYTHNRKLYTISYYGDEPLIKSSQAEPDSESEELFYMFNEAEYNEIPTLLEQEKNRTFEQAVEDDIPLGGYLATPYEEWVATILR